MTRVHKNTFIKLFPLFFYSLLIIFLVLYIKSIDFNQLNSVTFSWRWVIVATLFGLMARYWGTFIWLVILHRLGATRLKQNFVQLTYVYAKSWLGRYIPGTAPWILGKIYFASRQGISKSKLAVSSLLEGALQIVVVMALSFMMLIFDSRLNVLSYNLKFAMSAVLIICMIALVPRVFNFLIKIAFKVIRKSSFSEENNINGKILAEGSLLYTIGALINGLSLFFIAKAVYIELDYTTLLFIMSAGNLAGAIGMLAIFVPSGIGVREGVQIALLSLVVPLEIAVVITLVTRVWGVFVDILFFGTCKITTLLNNP